MELDALIKFDIRYKKRIISVSSSLTSTFGQMILRNFSKVKWNICSTGNWQSTDVWSIGLGAKSKCLQMSLSLSLLLFLYLFVIVFVIVIVFFLVYICQWYEYLVDGGRDAGNSRPSSQLRYRPLRCAIHWWHPSQSGFELSWQEWISSKKLRWAIAKRRQRPSDWVSDPQPPTLMISWYILYITCIV